MQSSPQYEAWRNMGAQEAVFQQYYRTAQEMPGHPWDHALMVRNVAHKKAVKAIAQHGMHISIPTVDLASLGHDMRQWEEPGVDYTCCSSKEMHSGHLAGTQVLPQLYTPPEIVDHTTLAIRATERGVGPDEDAAAKCVCQGDMWSVINEDPRFILMGTINFFREKRILDKNPIDGLINLEELTDFAEESYEYLPAFLEEELSLGPWDVDSYGLTKSQRGMKNIEQLHPKVFPHLVREVFGHLLEDD